MAIERVWWLTDPLFALEGNDRWTEHVNRVHTTRLYLISYGVVVGDLHRRLTTGDMRKSSREWAWGRRVPRGVWDSWTRLARTRPDGTGFNFFTGRNAARYHFVPDFEDGDLERPVWRLEAELDDEGYTPPYGTFHELPTQTARFRPLDGTPGSMRVAVAGTVAGTEMAGAAAEPHLVFSDAPESFPVHHTSELVDDRAAFLVDIPAERYVLSYEVLGDGQFGRDRQMLEPLRTDGLGVSDVLLYRPNGEEPPESREAAAELMLAETAIRPGEELGVYWETYGVEEGTPVEIEVVIEGESGGFFSRLRGLLPGGNDHTPVRLGWSEASPGPHFPRGVVLEPGNLEEGSYTLVIRAAWEGREPFELRREFEVR